MSTATKKRYRVPSISVDNDVSLNEFAEEDIVGYLRHQGYTVTGGAFGNGDEPGYMSGGGADGYGQISWADFDRINTLALCGQGSSAREFAWQVICEAIGRPL